MTHITSVFDQPVFPFGKIHQKGLLFQFVNFLHPDPGFYGRGRQPFMPTINGTRLRLCFVHLATSLLNTKGADYRSQGRTEPQRGRPGYQHHQQGSKPSINLPHRFHQQYLPATSPQNECHCTRKLTAHTCSVSPPHRQSLSSGSQNQSQVVSNDGFGSGLPSGGASFGWGFSESH